MNDARSLDPPSRRALHKVQRITSIADKIPRVQPFFKQVPFKIRDPLELVRAINPPNWDVDVSLTDALSIIEDEGIPLVWVPRAEIVKVLVTADSRERRIEILEVNAQCVARDCAEALDTVNKPPLIGSAKLAGRAVEAFIGGHFESAQALAVVVAETVVARAYRTEKYHKIVNKSRINLATLPASQIRLRFAIAAVETFFVDWNPKSKKPVPLELSRHVSVHQADSGHYNMHNALLAIMLTASVVRALQDFY